MHQELRGRLRILIAVGTLSMFCVIPLAVFATHEGVDHPTETQVFPLVTCGTKTDTVPECGFTYITNPCNACDLFDLAKRALDAIWWILAVPIATIMFIYAGSLMLVSSMGGGTGTAERGKRIFWNVIIGVLIAFFGWLIVDTVIKFLAGQNIGEAQTAELFEGEPISPTEIGYGPWNAVKCTRPTVVPPVCPAALPPSTGGGPTPPPGSPPPASSPDGAYTESQARDTLRAEGIPVNKSCVSKTTRYQDLSGGQTCLDGIGKATVDGVTAFKKESKCGDVAVTGGTEAGHSAGTVSHGTGYKIDVARTACVSGYIEKNYRDAGKRTDGARIYISPAGIEWAKEHDHWDVKGWEGTRS